MAKFEKGHKKKGGREKGIENKITQDARELFISVMEGQVPFVKESLAEVRKEDHATYLKLLTNLFPYFISKKTDVTTNGKDINMTDSKPFHEWADDDKAE